MDYDEHYELDFKLQRDGAWHHAEAWIRHLQNSDHGEAYVHLKHGPYGIMPKPNLDMPERIRLAWEYRYANVQAQVLGQFMQMLELQPTAFAYARELLGPSNFASVTGGFRIFHTPLFFYIVGEY